MIQGKKQVGAQFLRHKFSQSGLLLSSILCKGFYALIKQKESRTHAKVRDISRVPINTTW